MKRISLIPLPTKADKRFQLAAIHIVNNVDVVAFVTEGNLSFIREYVNKFCRHWNIEEMEMFDKLIGCAETTKNNGYMCVSAERIGGVVYCFFSLGEETPKEEVNKTPTNGKRDEMCNFDTEADAACFGSGYSQQSDDDYWV